MNHRGFSNIVIAIILLALLVGLGGYLVFFNKRTTKQEISQEQPSIQTQKETSKIEQNIEKPEEVKVEEKLPSQSATINWESLIPVIRPILKSTLDEPIELESPLRIVETADITGDGIPEALVDLGTRGAYTFHYTLMRIENQQPVVVQFKQKNGKISPLIFFSGASVRHGETVEMLPHKSAIYSGSYSTDDFGRIDSCEVNAYKWNAQTKIFEFDFELSNEIKRDFCSKLSNILLK